MAEITAALVKDLREKSGAGMMDCKKALHRDRRRHRSRHRLAAHQGPVQGRQEGRPRRRRGPRGRGRARRGRGHDRRGDRAQRRDRLRRPQRTVPGRRARDRRRRPWTSTAMSTPSPRPRLADGETVGDAITDLIATIGENMIAAPRGALRRDAGRGRDLRPQRRRAGPRPHRRAGGASKAKATRPSWSTSAARSPCTWPPPRRCRCRPTTWIRPPWSASAPSSPNRPLASGKPAQRGREDGRGPHPQVLRGGRAAQAGLRDEPGPDHRAARGRRPPRRSARRSRWSASPAWRSAKASRSRKARTLLRK